MILGVYSVRDIHTGFLAPTFELNDAVALRNYRMACANKDLVIGFEPKDFELMKLAEFDTNTGEFILMDKKVVADEKL